MFEVFDMTPRALYKEITEMCEDRYDTIEYVEKSQYIHVIKLTRVGYENIEVVCNKPYEHSVTYETALSTVKLIIDEYPEREVVWWG